MSQAAEAGRVAVVGGGIAGLSAALELSRDAEVTLFEEAELGGCIRTAEFAGHRIELGPDAFITRVPEAIGMCVELGVENELVAPSAGRSMIWGRAHLREFPEGTVMGVPRRLGPMARSGILSPAGLARAALDLVLPAAPVADDVSARELVSRRLGTQVADRLVGPLVGGINAGDIAELSAADSMPQIWNAAQAGRSLIRTLNALPAAPDAPLFLTPRDGLGRLVDAATDRLTRDGVTLTRRAVRGPVRRVHDRIEVEAGLDFDAVVLAVPPRRAALLLGGDVAAALEDVVTVSVTMLVATLSGVELPKGVNGFVAEHEDRRLLTACSFASNKWPHWSAPDTPLVRISAGRRHDERISGLSDEQVTERLLDDLGRALMQRIEPVATRVVNWPHAFPQYRPGHTATMRLLQEQLDKELPGVAVAGSAFGGIGIPACIGSGRRAAARVANALGARSARR